MEKVAKTESVESMSSQERGDMLPDEDEAAADPTTDCSSSSSWTEGES